MSRVLLIKPPFYRILGQQSRHCPLGLCYIGAVLERNGFEVAIYDADWTRSGVEHTSVRDMTQKYYSYLKVLQDPEAPVWKEIESVIRRQAPDIVGLSVMTVEYDSALNLSRIVRRLNPEATVIWGGVHPTLLPEETLGEEEVDYVVVREGEYTMLELLQNLHDPSGVAGIAYKRDGSAVVNPPRPYIENLDELPFPAKHLILADGHHPEAYGNVFTGRGCPYRCTFCASNKVWTRRVRYRSPDNVIAEVKEVKRRWGSSHFTFEDDTFTIDRRFTAEICRRLMAERLNITWQCQTRADAVSDDLVKLMKRAGCTSVDIGVETGDEETMRLINKGVTIDQIRNARKILQRHKVLFNATFMIGFPWETREQIDRTLALMKELDPDSAGYGITTPYPGTELWDTSRDQGAIPAEVRWSSFFHQSPEAFLSPHFTRAEAVKLVEETETIFEEHNKRKSRQRLYKSPLYVLKRVLRRRYSPRELWQLLRFLR